MRKKILSIILALTMVLGVIPFAGLTAFAENGITSWSALQAAINGASTAQTTITLGGNVVCNDQSLGSITISENKNIILDLNGYKIDRNLAPVSGNDKGPAIVVNNSTLTVQDNSAKETGTITGGFAWNSGGIKIENSATATLKSGTISGNYGTLGAGVRVDGGSTFNMCGGVIKNNLSQWGGGISNSGTINMTAGEITDNIGTQGGAGIFMDSGNATITGGKITGNKAGGQSYDEKGDQYSGGIKLKSNASLTIGGTAVIKDNFGNCKVKSGSTKVWDYTGLSSEGTPGNLFLCSGAKVAIATGNDAPKDGMKVGVNIADGTTGAFTTGVFTTATATAGQEGYFFADAADKRIVFDSKTLKIANGITSWSALQDAINAAGSALTVITLTQDLTASSSDSTITIPTGKDIVLDLNGKTLNANAVQNGAIPYQLCAITVSGKLTVQDSSSKKTGTITGGYTWNAGGIEIKNSGTVTLKSGTISGNCGVLGAGVRVASGSTFNMEGGTVKDNCAQWGAGITNASGTVNITGGQIINNQSSQGGSGINSDGGKLTITGGLFSGNKGGSIGCGANDGSCIRLNGSSTLTIGGTVVIRDNFTNCGTEGNEQAFPFVMGQGKTQGNLYINNNTAKVTIAGGDNAPKDGMKVGVTKAADNGLGVFTNANDTDYSDKFSADDTSKVIKYNADQKLELVKAHTHTKGTSYMTDGKAHWLTCAGEDCPLKTVEDYLNAFADASTGAALKEALGYKETVDKGGLMGRQGLITDNVVSQEKGRTIIGLTQAQLNSIDEKLLVIGCDENGKEIKVEVDCAYTYFYDLQPDGSYQKIEANSFKTKTGEQIIAFVIIDKDQNSEAISGYGYYRLYNGTADTESNFITDVLYVPNKEN